MERAELYAAIKERGGIADLSDRAKFKLTGSDRVRYLNGQVTNDVRKLTEARSIHACVTTAKGKMCGDIFISAGPDFLWLDADAALRESLAARLERYIISEDVTLEDVTEQFAIIHLLMPLGGHCSVGNDRERILSPLSNRQFPGSSETESRDLIVRREQFAESWKSLVEKFPVVDAEMQETFRVEAGIPRWGFELTEETIPVEAGLERTAIDYNKGCYIGQEIISRLKSIGHVNKQMRGFVSDEPLARGMELFAPADDTKPVGWLTTTAFSFGLARHAALGYLKRGVGDSVLTARGTDETHCRVEVRDLPLIP